MNQVAAFRGHRESAVSITFIAFSSFVTDLVTAMNLGSRVGLRNDDDPYLEIQEPERFDGVYTVTLWGMRNREKTPVLNVSHRIGREGFTAAVIARRLPKPLERLIGLYFSASHTAVVAYADAIKIFYAMAKYIADKDCASAFAE